MAEPVFEDGDPRGEYLKEMGDTMHMPGHSTDNDSQNLLSLWTTLLQSLHSLLHPPRAHHGHQPSPFAERFKYDIISSSLLATTATSHSRAGSSIAHEDAIEIHTATADEAREIPCEQPHAAGYTPIAALLLTLAVFITGYHTLALLGLATAGYVYAQAHTPTTNNDKERKRDDEDPNMEALSELIAAGSAWDAMVHDTIALLESEERALSLSVPSPHASFPQPNYALDSPSPSKKPPFPLSPASTALRAALHAALASTHTHCDNIRALFAALTRPSELAQLAEMYAPPSPAVARRGGGLAGFGGGDQLKGGGGDNYNRPLSLPGSRLTTPSRDRDRDRDRKRSTWNGTVRGGGNVTIRKRRERGERSLDFGRGAEGAGNEKGGEQRAQERGEEGEGEGEEPFGPDALGLHRARQSNGLSHLLSLPMTPQQTSRFPVTPMTPMSNSSTYPASPSPVPRTPFTPYTPHMHMPRHNLSLSALHHALHGALSSKRFACAHLLALRFVEDDNENTQSRRTHPRHTRSRRTRTHMHSHTDADTESDEERERAKEKEAYWEDVRAVMDLLTGTLGDAAARLGEALADAEEQRRRDGNPTPLSEKGAHVDAGDQSVLGFDLSLEHLSPSPVGRVRTAAGAGLGGLGGEVSFAPMPSRLSRFAGHVDAIAAAMEGAKENLEECVSAIRKQQLAPHSEDGEEPENGAAESENEWDQALLAYERLRRELGVALRECERGRDRLLELIASSKPAPPHSAEDEGLDGDATDPEDLPGLASDRSVSDKRDSLVIATQTPSLDFQTDLDVCVASPEADDATAHLLRMASALHLPPQGAEQVFEAEPELGVGAFTRERSKLSREERIRVMKAKRDSGLGLLDSEDEGEKENKHKNGSAVETWGPGVDVVQELKDVIWQVGERRRKRGEAEL